MPQTLKLAVLGDGMKTSLVDLGSAALLPLVLLLATGCGRPHTNSVLSPAEPEPVSQQDSTLPDSDEELTHDTDSEADEEAPETAIEPEPEPEEPPPTAWTAPPGDDIPCENIEVPFTFDGTASDYSLGNAFWTMWFAKRSFSGGDEATEAELRGLGFNQYRFIANDIAGLQVLIVANDESMFVTYQGSKEIMDWFANAYFIQRDAQYGVSGRVHQGFATVLDVEWSEILNTIELFWRPGQKVWTSGHSLGAALATLTAARLVDEGFDVAPLYTHASPRVGDNEFANALYAGLGEKHFRFVHGLDLIPHLPPAGAAAQAAANFIPLGITSFGESFLRDLDYTHAGSLYRMEMDATITHFPGLQEDEDNAYWSDVGFGTILELLVSQEQEALHNENSYLCRLQELWLASPEAP